MEGSDNATAGAGLMNKVKDGAVSQLNTQKDRATDGIGSVAQAVRQSTQHLRDQQHDTIAQYVDQAAAQLERFSTALKEKNVADLLDEAQRFARRNPALFVGGAFAVGLLSARFFKSSRDRSSEASWRDRFSETGRGYGDYGRSSATTVRYPREQTGTPIGERPAFDTGRS